jgi:dihydroxyacetone kinase-like predicted kinase
MAHRVAQDLAHMDTPRLGPDADPREQDELLAEVLERALEAGKDAVQRGPDQLPILREAGVVDAGAYGLTVVLAGVVGALRGQPPPEIAHEAPLRSLHLPQHESSRYRFCTNFAVSGEGLESSEFVRQLEGIGDSVLVVGDDHTLRVHVHTDDPDAAQAIFVGVGEVSRFDVADMREQIAERLSRLEVGRCGVVAVAAGEGIERLFAELGAHVVPGGETLNPSTYEILAGIHDVPAEEVLVLPNSKNVVMAAERACELSEKPARVVPSTSQQAGLLVLLEMDTAQAAAENADRLDAALGSIATGGVAPAARDDGQGRFRRGDAVGFAGAEIVAWGGTGSTLAKTIERLAEGAEIVTVIGGEDAPLPLEEAASHAPEGVEIELHEGGQPSWWWLLAAQ